MTTPSPVLRLWLALSPRSRRAVTAPAATPQVLPRPAGPLVWVHPGPETEPAAILELVRRLRDQRPEVTVLLSRDGTPDVTEGPSPGMSRPGPRSSQRAGQRGGLRPSLLDVAAPPDTPAEVAAFLDHWKPDLAVRTGLGLAPATMAALERWSVPLVLIDLHLPLRGARTVWRVPGLARALLRPVHRLLAADAATAEFLRGKGALAERVEVLGHLPDATGALPCNEAERAATARGIGSRPVWLAMAPSTAELPLVLAAHRHAMRRAHRLLLILAPVDDPETCAAAAEAEGLAVARRWTDADPAPDTEVWVADGIDERALWYRLAQVTFLGQTIEPSSGEASAVATPSPYEPAALGSAILHGPQTGALAAAYGKLMRAGATLPVRSATELGQALEMLQSPDRVAALAHAAWDVASSGAEVADRVIELVVAMLDAREVSG
ncbi:MAG: 3-deoxy-D-manno-octulosonic acid transferase [Rhodobacteraceae bacterium]|nr:3-deoxy-D-manno-octulosonic acid transferase [Paracoccaceae bacterium]